MYQNFVFFILTVHVIYFQDQLKGSFFSFNEDKKPTLKFGLTLTIYTDKKICNGFDSNTTVTKIKCVKAPLVCDVAFDL